MGRDSSVSIATRYWLDDPGIESQWVVKFSATSQAVPGAHPASYIMGIGSLPGEKRPEGGVENPSPSRVEVKERVELSLSEPSWPVLG